MSFAQFKKWMAQYGVDLDQGEKPVTASPSGPGIKLSVGDTVLPVFRQIPQMLTMVCGNSIAAQSRYNVGNFWALNSEIHIANAIAGDPLRWQRMSATTYADLWGVYGNSGKRLDEINADIETGWIAPIVTAGVAPDLLIGHALLENDIGQGASFAQCQSRVKIWIAMCRRWPGVRLLINTPRPSYSYDTAEKVAVYKAISDWIMDLDDGASIFCSRLNTYEDPANPGKPLSGYTDASVHPNTKGAWANARVIATTLRRVASGFVSPYRAVSNNFALSGSVSVGGTNVQAGSTGPTGMTVSGGTAGAGVVVLTAGDPEANISVSQVAGASTDVFTAAMGAITIAGGASTQISPSVELEIVSGAEFLRAIQLEPRVQDGGGNTFQYYIKQVTSDVDGDYRNGDVITMTQPPIVANSGTISAVQNYLRVFMKTSGTSSVTVTGTVVFKIRKSGVRIVVP